MNRFDAFNARALAETTAFLGSPFTYKGTVYRGVVGSRRIENTWEDGGSLLVLAIIIVVSKAILPTSPKSGELLTVNNQSVRIKEITDDEVSFELTCVSDRK